MARKITPSDEQQACIDFAVKKTANLLISALAGAAKTTTLVMIANSLPKKTNGLCLAFNKRIVEELREVLPSNIDCLTLNSIGYRAWKDKIGGRVFVDARKSYKLFEEYVKQIGDDKEKDAAWDSMTSILKCCGFAKTGGHVPDSISDREKCEPLMSDQDVWDSYEEILTPAERRIVMHILTCSMELAFKGNLDFDDQLLMPTVFRAPFSAYSLVMVDEAQDLSALNHKMLAKLVRRRLIAVGDQCQAIYAFRGAHEDGMAEMKRRFDMTELTLSTSYRCPQVIVDHVLWRAPAMKAYADNPRKGSISVPKTWSIADLPDSATIIARNNAPLFRLAVGILKTGRRPNLWGRDIGAPMLKVMKKLGPKNMKSYAAKALLIEWRDKELAKSRVVGMINDRYECIRIFLEEKDTLGGAIEYAEDILRSEGPIDLLTSHKAKGHEFTNVYIMEPKAFKDEGQDPNVRYVAITRTLDALTYIEKENCEEYMAEEAEAAAALA
jgi:superfamily I DNA/RNA helicase